MNMRKVYGNFIIRVKKYGRGGTSVRRNAKLENFR